MAPRRIVSLVPSQTELLWFLGLENQVVGITKFCVHPREWLAKKTIIGGTKNIHLDKVKAINADLVIANKEENVKEQVEALAKDHPVWVTDVNNLEEALEMIRDIGQLTHRREKAEQLAAEIGLSFSEIEKITFTVKTAYLIWRNPLMAVGANTFIHDMLSRCGFHNIFDQRSRYFEITAEDLRELNCELLFLSSEPYPFKDQHIQELQSLLPTTKIMLADGELFSWYGSRLLQSPKYFNRLIAEIEI